jgi:hypothetical protein
MKNRATNGNGVGDGVGDGDDTNVASQILCIPIIPVAYNNPNVIIFFVFILFSFFYVCLY